MLIKINIICKNKEQNEKNILISLILVLALVFTACASNGGEDTPEDLRRSRQWSSRKSRVIGVSPAPHAEIVEALEDEFIAAGIEIDLVTFDDYVQPNLALDDGDLDMNYFQHSPT